MTGVYNYNARMYRSGEGVFMQTDPIGSQDGSNLYGYVLNDPVNLVDPTGLDTELAPPWIWCLPPECNSGGGPVITGMPDPINLVLHNLGDVPVMSGISINTEPRDSSSIEVGDGPNTPNPVCPASNSTIGQIRHWASRTADITGKAADVTALAGAIPTPLSPGLEASAGGLKAIDAVASGVQIGADLAYWAQSGNSSVLTADVANLLFQSFRPGGLGASISRHRPGGSTMSDKSLKRFSDVMDSTYGLSIDATLPEACK